MVLFFSNLEQVGSGPSMLQLMEFSVIFKIALILCLLPVVCEHLFDCDQPVVPVFWCLC